MVPKGVPSSQCYHCIIGCVVPSGFIFLTRFSALIDLGNQMKVEMRTPIPRCWGERERLFRVNTWRTRVPRPQVHVYLVESLARLRGEAASAPSSLLCFLEPTSRKFSLLLVRERILSQHGRLHGRKRMWRGTQAKLDRWRPPGQRRVLNRTTLCKAILTVCAQPGEGRPACVIAGKQKIYIIPRAQQGFMTQ